ncbi:hypothetical protein Vretifemale_2948 [Volvox reticuliferus]|uniref:Uncharacterized protein n=1 Tax=Volvox reticuliferus TaxID=1737510 RepID=A0A8J4C118_9CHLO|nr:hypothetical protein Vretifemale_2948 [Volvox reticuliferus]
MTYTLSVMAMQPQIKYNGKMPPRLCIAGKQLVPKYLFRNHVPHEGLKAPAAANAVRDSRIGTLYPHLEAVPLHGVVGACAVARAPVHACSVLETRLCCAAKPARILMAALRRTWPRGLSGGRRRAARVVVLEPALAVSGQEDGSPVPRRATTSRQAVHLHSRGQGARSLMKSK